MVAVVQGRPGFTTILSPGQRFQSSERPVADLTVARLVMDRLGLLHVTLRSDDGHEISAFAEQVEVAIAEGHLSPVIDTFPAASTC